MFNVLPENLKADIITFYKARRLVVWLVMCVVLVIIFYIALFPAYISLIFQEKDEASAANAGATVATSSALAQIGDIDAVIHAANQTLLVLSTHLSYQSLNQVLSRIVSLKGAGISFKHITYTRGAATATTLNSGGNSINTGIVTIEGTATTREGLLAFEKRLQADPTLSGVNLPVSDFAKSTSLDFSISLSISQSTSPAQTGH